MGWPENKDNKGTRTPKSPGSSRWIVIFPMKMEGSGGILHSQTHPDSHSPSHSVRIHRPRGAAADSFFAVAKRVLRAPGLRGRKFCMAAEKGPVRYTAPIHVDWDLLKVMGSLFFHGLTRQPGIHLGNRWFNFQVLSYKALFPSLPYYILILIQVDHGRKKTIQFPGVVKCPILVILDITL